MKKLYSLVAVAMISVAAFAQTPTQVVNETFSYTGALNANGWSTHSGTSAQLLADGTTGNMVAGSSEDLTNAFSTPYPVSAGMINRATYSATINVPSATGLTTSGDYFLMLAATSGATVTNFYGRLFIKGSATGYTLGILNNSGGTASYGTEIPYGTAANILVDYTVNNSVTPATNVATLQINAQPLLTNGTGTGALPTNIASIAIREAGNATSGTGSIKIDDIIVTTYSSYLAVSDLASVKNTFVKNTFVQNEINFGAKADVKIYSMNGQVVKSASVSENKSLEVADLASGMYIVTGTVEGQAVSTKIIKK